jgi:hypothetical protein
MHSNRRAIAALLMLLALPLRGGAGAWEAGSFENDNALDWAEECSRAPGSSLLVATLEAALRPAYLEAPDASTAVAAAEVIAAARGKPGANLPKSLNSWLQRQPVGDIAKLAPTASRAMDRILNGPGSELQELWKESASYDSWRRNMRELEGRLK